MLINIKNDDVMIFEIRILCYIYIYIMKYLHPAIGDSNFEPVLACLFHENNILIHGKCETRIIYTYITDL